MRILQIVEPCQAGVGRHVTELTAGLLEAHHQVHLLYSPLRIDERFRQALAGPCAAARSQPVRMLRRPSFDDRLAWRSIRRYIRQHGPFDIIHTHSTKAGVVGRLAALGLPGHRLHTPNAPLSLSPEIPAICRWLAGACEQVMGRLSDAVIAVSPSERDHLLSIGVPARRVHVVPNGIRLSAAATGEVRAAAQRRIGLCPGTPCIGFVGRLAAQKRCDVLLRAFALLPLCVRSRTRLVIVGDGVLAGTLRRLAAELGIATNITWMGEIDAGLVMPAFDLLAISSSYEGLPYVLLEAMSLGLPVVSTRVGGTELLGRDGLTGFTVPPLRSDLFASALESLLTDESLRIRLGHAARSRVELFGFDAMLRGVQALYRLAGQKRELGIAVTGRSTVY